MRLFVAILFDKKTKAKLENVQKRLKKYGTGRFQEADMLHMTLAFLGEVPKDLLPVVKNVLKTVDVKRTILKFDKVGDFSRGSDVWWAGTEENAVLANLRNEITEKLSIAEIPYEKGLFIPHVTLARAMDIREKNIDKEAILSEPFECEVSSFCLMQSKLGNGRSDYTVLERYGNNS